MKKILGFVLLLIMVMACTENKKPAEVQKMFSDGDDLPADSTLYGTCGEVSKNGVLSLVTGLQDTLKITIDDEDSEEPTIVAGSLMNGDRLAVVAYKREKELVARRVINLTSLLGQWEGADKGFELAEGGEVNAIDGMENPRRWTNWRILNGQLVISKDTFDVLSLNVDSMDVEDKYGIYSYYRIRKDSTHAADEEKDVSL